MAMLRIALFARLPVLAIVILVLPVLAGPDVSGVFLQREPAHVGGNLSCMAVPYGAAQAQTSPSGPAIGSTNPSWHCAIDWAQFSGQSSFSGPHSLQTPAGNIGLRQVSTWDCMTSLFDPNGNGWPLCFAGLWLEQEILGYKLQDVADKLYMINLGVLIISAFLAVVGLFNSTSMLTIYALPRMAVAMAFILIQEQFYPSISAFATKMDYLIGCAIIEISMFQLMVLITAVVYFPLVFCVNLLALFSPARGIDLLCTSIKQGLDGSWKMVRKINEHVSARLKSPLGP